MPDKLTSPVLILPGDALTFMHSLMAIDDQKRTISTLATLKAMGSTDIGEETFEGLATSCAESMLINKIANHVARGEQNAAKTELTSSPELALEETAITGYTQHPTFANTAIKYAAWARDHHMLQMIIDQITLAPHINTAKKHVLITELLKQVREIPERFSLKPLKVAYNKYLAEYTTACTTNDWTECDAAWLAIGIEQNKLPANVAQHYCDQELPLDSCPNFDFRTARFERNLNFYNWLNGQGENWFGVGVVGRYRLSFDFAIFGTLCGAVARRWAARVVGDARGGRDLSTIEALDATRTEEVQIIETQLTQLLYDLESRVAPTQCRQRPTF